MNLKFRSKAQNITSDEAECSRLNGGDIYYLDEEKKQVIIRLHLRTMKNEYILR